MKNGWHIIAGSNVYVENGFVVRGLSKDSLEPLFIYRISRRGGYDMEYKITPAAFRAGMKRGTVVLH